MRLTVILVCACIIAGCKSAAPRTIVVSGASTVRVPVDYFTVSVTVRAADITFARANGRCKALVGKLFGVFGRFGVADSDFVTRSSESSTRYFPRYERRNADGRKVAVEYSGTLTLRNPEIYDALFEAIAALGEIEVGVRDFGSNAIESSKRRAYREAVGRARERALMLIEGTGQTLGPIVKLLQDGRDRTDAIESLLEPPEERAASIMSFSALAAGPRPPSTFRKRYLDETRSVTVVYELR